MSQRPFVGSEFPEADFLRIRDFLLEKRGFDLAKYKDRCIKRRIAGRVRALGFSSAPPYLEVLASNSQEVDLLLAALTINVSQFFRNPAIFAALEERVLPELIRLALCEKREEVRLWSAGCARGGEPYSLSLLAEQVPQQGVRVSILATDINPLVLDGARQGIFDELRLAEVPQEVRERYFIQQGVNWRLAAEVRGRVVFQLHNLIDSAPYPAADLILCRNVLIYFSREEQDQILEKFAAALPAGGFLVLGQSESLLGDVRSLFEVENPTERIYRRR